MITGAVVVIDNYGNVAVGTGRSTDEVIGIPGPAGPPGPPGITRLSVVSPAQNYSASPTDMVLANAAIAPFTVILPNPATVGAGAFVWVKKIDSTANAITVITASGLVDGAASFSITQPNSAFVFIADAYNWNVF